MFFMALAQENNYSDVDNANKRKIRAYRKQARRTSKKLKGKWDSAPILALPSISAQAKKKRRLPRYVCTPSGLTFDFKILREDTKTNAKQRFSDICVMVIGTNGKGKMLRCLLDTGCSKSIVLKKFPDKKQRSKLCD